MQVNIQKIDGLKHRLNIELTGKELTERKDKFYAGFSQNLKVPGFRPGKAPLELIKKHHGRTLQNEFMKKHLPLIYREAVQRSKIAPAGLPRINNVEIKDDSLSFSAEVETQPEVEINEKSYQGIRIKGEKTDIDAHQIEKTITNFKNEVKKISGKDLDDAQLAKWASYPDIDSFKEAISAQLKFEKLQQRKRGIENQIKDHLLKAVKFSVPRTEVERYQKQLLQGQINQLRQQGIEAKEIDKYKGDFEKKLQPIAENEIKFFYILRAIAKREEIKEDKHIAESVMGFILSQAKIS